MYFVRIWSKKLYFFFSWNGPDMQRNDFPLVDMQKD